MHADAGGIVRGSDEFDAGGFESLPKKSEIVFARLWDTDLRLISNDRCCGDTTTRGKFSYGPA
jgi:hypothetical protein